MKKKISAICMAVALSIGAMPVSQAASLADLVGVLPEDTVTVGADMSLGQSPAETFNNGPLSISSRTLSPITVDYRALIKMDAVLQQIELYEAGAEALGISDEEIAAATVSGEFVVTINYPTQNFTVPDSVITGTDMAGFESVDPEKDLTAIFNEVSRDASEAGKLTITVGVEDVGLQTLKDNLNDMMFTCREVEITQFGTYTVTGEVTGTTVISCPEGDLKTINYQFEQIADSADSANRDAISATVQYSRRSGGGSLTGGNSQVENRNTLTIVVGDDIENITSEHTSGSTINTSEIQKPSRAGYIFDGFYYDPEFENPVGETITMNDDTTIYVKWIAVGTEILEMEKHYAYIIGYPTDDGRELVMPENNITREEVATIFYRLLKPEPRSALHSLTNDFNDVDASRWSNEAISTVANGGYIVGYDDGSFKPADPITRAEFVTIAARLFGAGETIEGTDQFSDVSGHWAEDYINFAVDNDWIDGYDDGTLKPDQFITRAEVMRIINNMLNRHVDAEGIVDAAKTWDDNSPSAWYYYDVIEATNAHIYMRDEGETTETWQEVVENDLLANMIDPEKVEVEVEVTTDETDTTEETTDQTTDETDATEETTDQTTDETDATEETTDQTTDETNATDETSDQTMDETETTDGTEAE